MFGQVYRASSEGLRIARGRLTPDSSRNRTSAWEELKFAVTTANRELVVWRCHSDLPEQLPACPAAAIGHLIATSFPGVTIFNTTPSRSAAARNVSSTSGNST